LEKTLVVWRRLGKEHGEVQGYRINPPEVVEEHIRAKVEVFRQTPEDDWHWYRVSDDLVIENGAKSIFCGEDAIAYYLPRKGWLLMEEPKWSTLDPSLWRWMAHIGDMSFSHQYGCWVFTDLFADVIIKHDNLTHEVLDLDDLAHAMEIGLIGADQAQRVLRSTQELINLIRAGEFPPQEVLDARPHLERLGWL